MGTDTHSPPETGQKVYFPTTTVRKFVPYKKDGARQMKRKGRWQEMVWRGDYFKWENCETPTTENWHLDGDAPVEHPALIAENEALREALKAIVERSENGDLGTSKVLDMKRIAALSLAKGEK